VPCSIVYRFQRKDEPDEIHSHDAYCRLNFHHLRCAGRSWSLPVVDDAGQPVADAYVRFSSVGGGFDDSLKTDKNGHAGGDHPLSLYSFMYRAAPEEERRAQRFDRWGGGTYTLPAMR